MYTLTIGESQFISQIGDGALMLAQERTGVRLGQCSETAKAKVFSLINAAAEAATAAYQAGPSAAASWKKDFSEAKLADSIAEILREGTHE